MLRSMFALPRSVLFLALATVVVHLVTNLHDGVFRDELYYLACADHLDWGYVDHPPLSILLLWLSRAIAGDSVFAIRILPALAGGVVVLLGAATARELNGGRFAQLLSALCVAVAPVYLGTFGFFSMNAFDVFFWALATFLLVRILAADDPKRWIAFGIVCGLGLQNKISVAFLGCGVVAAIVLTPLRRHLKTPYPWLAGLIAGLLFLPHVIWQIQNGWPTLEFIRNAQEHKISEQSPWSFFQAQLLEMGPLSAPIWLLGLAGLFLGRDLRRFRALGIVYVVVFLVLVTRNSKPYYLVGAYPPLMAAGAVAIERVLAVPVRGWARATVVAVVAIGGILLLPFAVPVLPMETFIRYQHALRIEPTQDENHDMGPLPQFYADRHGWREMTQAVAKIYDTLSPEEKSKTLIVGSNYGEAGALLYFGRQHSLPKAVSQHNSFYLWGPGTTETPAVVITIGMSPEDLTDTFESVVPAGRVDAPYAMPYETNDPICVCRGWKISLDEAWRQGRHYI